VTAYRREFYGPMTDAVNAGDPSDRLLITWRLTSPEVVAAAAGALSIGTPASGAHAVLTVGPDGEPIVGALGEPDLSCALPDDIVAMRRTNPELARAWRYALRDTLGAALEHGYRVTGVSRDGSYLLARPE
jgi:predicted GNAT superfamily acetyltransferase